MHAFPEKCFSAQGERFGHRGIRPTVFAYFKFSRFSSDSQDMRWIISKTSRFARRTAYTQVENLEAIVITDDIMDLLRLDGSGRIDVTIGDASLRNARAR